MREPLVLRTDDLDHLEDLVEALSEGYHIIADDPQKMAQYEGLLERVRAARS